MKNTKKTAVSGETPNAMPLGPSRGTKILKMIESALVDLHCRSFTYTELAEIAGLSTSTIFDWASGAQIRQVEALFRLLEQLPKPKRTELIDRICRSLPTIYHKQIAWRVRQISICEQLLRQPKGLTLIQGDENARDFLMTALAHSATRLDSPLLQIYGIDVRQSDHFVPADGIKYLGNVLYPGKTDELAQAAWVKLRVVKDGIILLNGVWSTMSKHPGEILAMTDRCHVIIGDRFGFSTPETYVWIPQSARFLEVKEEKDRRIHINIQRISLATKPV